MTTALPNAGPTPAALQYGGPAYFVGDEYELFVSATGLAAGLNSGPAGVPPQIDRHREAGSWKHWQIATAF